MTSKEKGRLSLARVLARLTEKGKHVLIPFADVGRYDLLIDENGKFTRIEVKTGRKRNGCIMFATSSRGGYGKKKIHLQSKPYTGDADTFAVFCSDTDKVYLIPVLEAPKDSMMLRVDEPSNRSNQTKIKWARDFEF